ncbi:MAG TPA: response regulator transcription factor [Candidatus Dormibacteraeota bacterium]|nr:response regulator transcription factor [Candidatus Dormibacteraeota bacterium]
MRALLVEDDRQLLATLRRGLADSDITADIAADGEEGLAAASAVAYDVIVLDVLLPLVDGVELTRRLRARRVTVPIIMLTGLDAVEDRVRGLEAGADDYLVKPFALRELVARIRALVRRTLPDRSDRLTAGPLVLDLSAHQVSVHGAELSLSPKEYAILEHLMLNQGRLLTREQIMVRNWDYDVESEHNLVDVYMARIRRKLERAGAGDPITTVRGAGYRFGSRYS